MYVTIYVYMYLQMYTYLLNYDINSCMYMLSVDLIGQEPTKVCKEIKLWEDLNIASQKL